MSVGCGMGTGDTNKAADADGARPADRGAAGDSSDGAAGGGDFAAALAMIAALPLTDAEKAEAVRRLLAGQTGT